MLFEDGNSYHQNIKLTLEMNPSKFLDADFIREKGSILTQVFSKPHKLFACWSFKIPMRHKWNAFMEEFQEQKEVRAILIKKYGELKKNIEMVVFHQTLLMKLCNFKKETKETASMAV